MQALLFNFMTKDHLLEHGREYFSHFQLQELKDARKQDYSVTFTNGRSFGIIHMPEIYYEEIRYDYEVLCRLCGREKIEAVLIKDGKELYGKITKIIDLVMDEILKSDSLTIFFPTLYVPSHISYEEFRSPAMGNVLYSILQANYTIISQQIPQHGIMARVKIEKRRSENNDHNAN